MALLPAPQAPSKVAPSTQRRIEALVFVAAFLDLIGFGLVIPILPLYVDSMGAEPRVVGYLLSCYSLLQVLATPVLGGLSDRFGRRPVIIGSLLGNAAAMLLFAAATELRLLPLLFASRLLAGATAGNLSTLQAVLADVSQGPDRARMMGRMGAGIGLGLVLGPVIGGLTSKIGPWAPPAAAATMAIVDLVGIALLMPETRPTRSADEQAKSPPPRLSETFADPSTSAVLVLYFGAFLCLASIQMAFALFTKQRFGWSEVDTGHAFGMFGLGSLLLQGALLGPLTRAFGQTRVLMAGFVCMASGMAIIATTATSWQVHAAMFVLSLGMGATMPVLSALASQLAGPTRQGAVLGVAHSAGGLARTVGPTVAGVLFTQVSPRAPFIGSSAVGASALLLAIWLHLRQESAARLREP